MEREQCTWPEMLICSHAVVLMMPIPTVDSKIVCLILSTGLGAAEGAAVGSLAAAAGAIPGSIVGATVGFVLATIKIAVELYRSYNEQPAAIEHQE
jgi:outer membrane lipoprotein SlyB